MDLKRVIINQIIILSLQVILYFGCEYFQKKPKNIATEFDKKIQFYHSLHLYIYFGFRL